MEAVPSGCLATVFFIMLYFAFGFKGMFNTRRQTQRDILFVYVHYIIIKVTQQKQCGLWKLLLTLF